MCVCTHVSSAVLCACARHAARCAEPATVARTLARLEAVAATGARLRCGAICKITKSQIDCRMLESDLICDLRTYIAGRTVVVLGAHALTGGGVALAVVAVAHRAGAGGAEPAGDAGALAGGAVAVAAV